MRVGGVRALGCGSIYVKIVAGRVVLNRIIEVKWQWCVKNINAQIISLTYSKKTLLAWGRDTHTHTHTHPRVMLLVVSPVISTLSVVKRATKKSSRLDVE
jgi:hypothetical protein